LFFSSNPNLGAILRPDRTGTYLGNNFDVRLPRPIALHNASNITVELSAINIWNSIPNISEEKGNNVLRIVDSKNANIDITIPKGSYVVDTLNTSLQRLLNDHMIKNDVQFYGDLALNRVIMEFASGSNIKVDFTVGNIHELLGFDKKVYDSSDGLLHTGEQTPKFNVVTSFLLHTDLVSDGIMNNNTSGLVIGKIPLIADPGHLIAYERINPFKVPADNLKTSGKQNINFKLTNEANEDIDMGGEYFDFALVIRYDSDNPFLQGQQSVVRPRI